MSAEPLHVTGPPGERLDVLITGDGYVAAELPHFRAAAARVAERLLANEPMASYRGLINVWRLDVVSEESGIVDRVAGRRPRTAFGARHDYLSPHAIGTLAPWRIGRHTRGAPRDVVLVLANSPRRGGWALPFTRTAFISFPPRGGLPAEAPVAGLLPTSPPVDPTFPGDAADYAAETCVHEFGHACGANLADEYTVPLRDHVGRGAWVFRAALALAACVERWLRLSFFPNVTFLRDRPPWPQLPPREGALGLARGAYRPDADCKMAAERHPFCAVCQDAIIRRSIYRFARPGRLLRDGRRYHVELAAPHLSVGWRVGGEPVPSLDGAITAELDAANVTVELVDTHPKLLGPPPRFTLRAQPS
jgi:hypothetical protein